MSNPLNFMDLKPGILLALQTRLQIQFVNKATSWKGSGHASLGILCEIQIEVTVVLSEV